MTSASVSPAWGGDAERSSEALEAADAALYASKGPGRDRVTSGRREDEKAGAENATTS